MLYVHEDIMGNTRYHTKDNGQSYAELEYDVWGNPTSPNMLLNNDNGVFITAIFTGHIYDTVIDVYFAQARFYDAKNRQWLNSDPMKDGLNWYQYVGANPVTFLDKTGLFGLPYSPVRDVPQSYRESPPTQSNNTTGNAGAAAATVGGGTTVAPKPVVNPAITQAAKQAVTSVARAVAAHPVAALIAVGGAIGVVAAQSPNNTYLTSIYAPPLEYYRPFTACPDKTETEAKRDVIPAIPKMEREPRATHHIVARTDSRAEEARIVLRTYKIDINSPLNLVSLPVKYHKYMNTREYHDYVNYVMKGSNSPESVKAKLIELRLRIQYNCVTGSFIWM